MARILLFPDMREAHDSGTAAPNRLREWRKHRRMTLQQIATAAGTTRAQVQRIETGVRPMSVAWMERFARILHVQVSDLLAPAHSGAELSPREHDLIGLYRGSDDNAREAIFGVAEKLSAYVPQGRIAPFTRPALAPKTVKRSPAG